MNDPSTIPGKVLVVDDNPVNRKIIITILAKRDIDCDVAVNGEAAVEMCGKNRYCIIFMDCIMPVMDGYSATKAIRDIDEYRDIPIIAITADTLPETRGKCIKAGMNDYISKPFNIKAILEMVDKHLNNSKPG